jgi:5-(carboxyamino)imidazole ribonucleotide synthase
MADRAGALAPGAVIGIVGNGQLGRMSAMAAARLGFRVHVFGPDHDAPAAQVAARATVAAYDDIDALRTFAASVDVVTFEFENVSAAGLDLLQSVLPVRPAPSVLRTSQDRMAEKRFLESAKVRIAPWAMIETEADLVAAVAKLGLPAVLKSSRLGYDGKGQAKLREPSDVAPAFARLGPKPLVLERFVDFACELSVVVARGADGDVAAFDTVENRHHDHILHATFAPARIDPAIAGDARAAAIRVAEALELVGLLCVEFFVNRDGRVLANEIAPRPHNSGHWTIEACFASQFEQHIRAVAGLPLGDARRHADAVMVNLIGPGDMALWPAIVATPGLSAHHYGKAEARPGRKMGHVTRLFPRDALPGDAGVAAAMAPLVLRGIL